MATIKGKVQDSSTGLSLSSVHISLNAHGVSNQYFSAATDSRGQFVITKLPAGIYDLYAQFDPPGIKCSFGSSVKNIELTDDTEKDLVVSIDVRGILVGKIRDASQGSPIQGATVRIMEDTGGQIASPTDSGGEFSMRFIRAGQYTVSVIAEGYESVIVPVHVDQILGETRETRIELFLKPLESSQLANNGTVQGNVVNQFGRPLLGSRIEVIGDGFMRVGSVVKDWVDIYNGNFSMRDIPPGEYRFVASRAGYESVVREISVEKGKVTWVNDIILKITVLPPPPELDYIKVEPEAITVGESIKVIIRSFDPEIIGISAHVWGPRGWNMGFTLDDKVEDGGRSRTFDNWNIAGTFVIDSVSLTDKHGYNISVNATFEVLPRSSSKPPLSSDSPIFRSPR